MFVVEDNGKVLVFEDNVRMVLRPDELKASQKKRDEAALKATGQDKK